MCVGKAPQRRKAKMPRPQNLRNIRPFVLYGGDETLGYRVTSRVSKREAEQMVRNGRAEETVDGAGAKCYRLLKIAVVSNGLVSSKPTPAVLSAREMQLIAGQAFRFGGSKTARMTEPERVTRVHPISRKPLAAEDEIERAVAKLEAFTPMHLRCA